MCCENLIKSITHHIVCYKGFVGCIAYNDDWSE